MNIKLFTFIFMVAAISQTISAQTQKFDVMTYTAPKGWTASQKGTAKMFSTVDKSAGKFCIMFLYPSVTNHGTPSQDFAFVWKTLVQDTFNSGGNPEKETTEADSFTIIQGGELIDYEGTKALALLTTVSGKGKVISILSIMNDAKYTDDIQAFLGAMDIDIKETPIQAQSKPQVTAKPRGTKSSGLLTDSGIAGVWTCYRSSVGSYSLSWYYKVFFSDGRALDRVPRFGLYNYDSASEPNIFVDSYSFVNGTGLISSRREKLKLLKQNELDIDTQKYIRAESVSGRKLSGSFTSAGSIDSQQLQNMSYGEKPVITFSKDGRFKDEGLFNTLLFDKGTNPQAAKPGDGNYELQDYSIILRYDDGRERQEAFVFPFASSFDDARMVLLGNGAPLTKVK
jgi:hypothetical protein